MITRQDLEDCRFRDIELEQQFAKLKMWQNRLNRLNTVYGSGRTAELLDYRPDHANLREIVDEIKAHIEDLSQKYKEINDLISRIADPKIKAVMTQYYVLCASDREEVGYTRSAEAHRISAAWLRS
ncbi:MAG: hypothetical protein NC452_09020 [Eubacterium sp.]|nr:hypothetical protein [Eubacterium sp.]